MSSGGFLFCLYVSNYIYFINFVNKANNYCNLIKEKKELKECGKRGYIRENKQKRKDTSVKESYTQWVKDIVQLIKLPFKIDLTYLSEEPDLSPISIEEVDRLKTAIAKLKQAKENLEYNLYDVTYEKNLVSYDLEQKDK